MNQSNPLPTEEQVAGNVTSQADLASPFADKRVSQRAFWAALLSAVVLMFSTFNTINQIFFVGDGLTLSPLEFTTWGVLIGAPTAFSLALAGAIQIRRGRVKTGLYLAYFSLYVIVFIATLLYSNAAVPAGSALGLISLVYILWIFPQSERRRPGIALGVFFAWLILLELISPAFRVALTAGTQNGPVLASIFLIAVIAYLVREGWNRSYTVGRKLLIAFGLLGALSLVVGIGANFGLSVVTDAYDHAIEDGGELRAKSLTLSNDLLTARRHEKDFLLRWEDQGFETAYQNYVIPNQGTVAGMIQHINEMSSFASTVGETFSETYTQAQYQSDLGILRESVDLYEREFQNTVRLIEEKGFQDTGLEGEFRIAVQNIEARILDREGLDPLEITMLQIRRREKDYLLRGDQQYVDNVHQLIEDLKSQVSATEELSASEKAEMRALADQYVVAFDRLVDIDVQIAAAIQAFRDAAHTIEPIVEKLTNAGQEMSNIDIATAGTADVQMRTLLTITMVVTLLFAIFISVFLARQISGPVRLLTNTAREIAGGNFDVQAEVISADEIGTLAETFNTMTKRLGEAFEDVRRRAAELSTVAEVSTATSTILESKQLLQNVVDLTKERFNLYHSHIYLLDEKGENLVLTAGAGEPGRIMVSEGRTIPLSREQSLVARAARDRQGVIVNDVTQEPDHLPNPLLPDTRSELAVPMVVAGTVVGVFDIQAEEVGRFTDTDVNIQTTLASQLATSIQNVRSFERSKKEAELQSLVNMIGSRIQRTTTIEETLQTAIRELGTAIGASRVKAKVGQSNGSSNPTTASN